MAIRSLNARTGLTVGPTGIDVLDALANATVTTVSITGTTDVTLTSTGNPIQIGLSSGVNLVMDNNEIQARNNGAGSALVLNDGGGGINLGDASSVVTVNGFLGVADGAEATPSIRFTSDTNTGIFRPAADTFAVSTAGAESFRIDPSQRFLKGFDTAIQTRIASTNVTPAMQMAGASLTPSTSLISSFSANATAPYMAFAKSRGAIGVQTITAANDQMGGITFAASDGTQFLEGARIRAAVDSTPSAGNMFGRLEFATADGGNTGPIIQMILDQAGTLSLSAGVASTSATTGTLVVTGGAGISGALNAGVVEAGLGSAAAPSITFTADDNTGFFRSSADVLGVTTAGTVAALFGSTGNFIPTGLVRSESLGSVTAPTYSFNSDNNTGIYSSAADTLNITTGGANRVLINASGVTITGGVATTGGATFAQIFTNDGIAGSPAYTFTSAGNTGMFLSGSVLSFSQAGITRARVTSTPSLQVVGTGVTSGGTLEIVSSSFVAFGGFTGGASGMSLYSATGPLEIYGSSVRVVADSGTFGYGNGSGGTVTQSTSKTTGVTLNAACGRIITSNSSIGANSSASFTLTNNRIATTDVVVVSIASGATAAVYTVTVDAVGTGSCRISIRSTAGIGFSETLTLNFIVYGSVTA